MARNKNTKGYTKKVAGKGDKKESYRKMNRKPRGTKQEGESYKGEPANDPRYYTNNPILTSLAASIPVNPVLGTKELWHEDMMISSSDLATGAAYKGMSIPGIMGISLIPAFGSDMESSSAGNASFNRLCANLYTMLVRDKSGTAPFDQAAVGHYLIAMRSAYILVHDLKRFISLVSYFQSGNKYFPMGIGAAIGRRNYTLTASELDAAAWEVNKLVRFLNTKFVPKMSVFARDFDLYSRLYADSDTEYAQYYCFFPRGMYIWNDATNSSVFTPFGATNVPDLPKSLADIHSIVTTVIDSLQNSDMINIINAWMRHVYQPGESWLLEEMPIGGAPVFVYDEYVLAQIENLRVCPMDIANVSNLDIIQNGSNNYLEYTNINGVLAAVDDTGTVGLTMNPTFNFHVTVPTEDMKLESSRLAVCAEIEYWTYDSGTHLIKAQASDFHFSDQIPVMLLVAEWSDSAHTFWQYAFSNAHATVSGYDNGAYLGNILPLVSMFKRHPIMWVTWVTTDSNNKINSMNMIPMGEIDTVASLDKAAFNRLSYTCTYSLFSVPGVTV